MAERLVEMSVEEFLDAVAAGSTRLASSSLAAATVAGATGLVAMAAPRWPRGAASRGSAPARILSETAAQSRERIARGAA